MRRCGIGHGRPGTDAKTGTDVRAPNRVDFPLFEKGNLMGIEPRGPDVTTVAGRKEIAASMAQYMSSSKAIQVFPGERERHIAEEAARIANKEHRARIEKEAVDSMRACLSDENLPVPKLAQHLLLLICNGKFRHVTINY